MTIRYSEIAAAVNGRLMGADGILQNVNTDTRSIQSGELFVALKGEKYDAHDFVEPAVRLGAGAVMVNKACDVSVTQIIVADTRLALGKMSAAWRKQFNIPVLGITGSNGKTTVKEMTASILSQKGETLFTKGNFNNDIGVPLTLMRINASHQFAVIEMGANHPGEIRGLVNLVMPTAALVNNAGPSHLEGFGSIEGVAKAKAEIYETLSRENTAVINADDDYRDYWRSVTMHCKRIEFSFDKYSNADVSGYFDSHQHLIMKTPVGGCTVKLPLLGEHNARNALAAAALAITAGATIEHIQQGLESVVAAKGRLQVQTRTDGVKVIDDTYNANPSSLKAALLVLKSIPGEHWLVLGSMGELGDNAEALHYEMGVYAKQQGIQKMFVLGGLAASAAKGFGENATLFDTHASLLAAIKNSALNSGVTILIKGSRAMKMENIVVGLLTNDEERPVHSSAKGA